MYLISELALLCTEPDQKHANAWVCPAGKEYTRRNKSCTEEKQYKCTAKEGVYSSLNYSDAIMKSHYCPRKPSRSSIVWQQENDVTILPWRATKKKKRHQFIANAASVGHWKSLLLFFSVFIPLTTCTLDLCQKINKTKWNSNTRQHLTCSVIKPQVLGSYLLHICWK